MAWIGSYMYNSLFGGNGAYDQDGYKPSLSDVLTIKEALHKKSTLPYELVDFIVDMAEYWPHSTTVTSKPTIVTTGRNKESDQFILRSYPLGYLPSMLGDLYQEADMDFKDEQAYQTLAPRPWPDSCPITDALTEETISRWSSRSLTKGEYPCRKIVFTIKSHDQGWGGQAGQRGTYTGSYTWFEAGLERVVVCPEVSLAKNPETDSIPHAPLNRCSTTSGASSSATPPEPLVCSMRTIIPSTAAKRNENTPDTFQHSMMPLPALTIQKNVVATRETKEHNITWAHNDSVVPDSLDAVELEKQGRGRDSANGEFVKNVKVGDVITVWAKARFAGWANHVQEVRMDVYWAV